VHKGPRFIQLKRVPEIHGPKCLLQRWQSLYGFFKRA
jgi:hypothetical protein